VGKSELLSRLLDSRFELISADSMQVYRHMDVGTAKPSADERSRFPHHLIDVADPSEQFNAGRFVNEAETIIAGVSARGKVSVVAGGTAFYITNLMHGLPQAPPVDPAIREKLRAQERTEGRAALYQLLLQSDPDAASRIPANDRYRVMRALEVLQSTGRSLYSFEWPRSPRVDMRFLLVGLDRPREDLYRRIDARVQSMFRAGLLGEVKSLLASGYGPGDPGMKGIGYRELLQMRAGCQTLADVAECISRSTRRYAKRQLTFFRSVPGVCWMSPEDLPEIRARVEAFVAQST
jgi:tRNA dimethylallyltransferase